MSKIQIEDISIEIVRKKIKNINLRVYPPLGRVCVSVPLNMRRETIKFFLTSRLSWIKQKQKKFKNREYEVLPEFTQGERHYFMGQPYRLRIVEIPGKAKVEINDCCLMLYVSPNASKAKRRETLFQWYRRQLKGLIPTLIERYEKLMKVKVAKYGIKKMKTRWGSCNPAARRIWINLELARKPPECLEYIVVHEMCHLLEPSHNSRFYDFINRFLPKWKSLKQELNRF